MEVNVAEAGIGVDIVEISRMKSILEKTPSFARRVFTEEERAYCDASSRPAAHYASRFASREAVLKALGTGFSQGVGCKDVSVTRDKLGKPKALLSGRALEIAQELGVVEVALSITLTGDLAVANAIAITEDARPKPKEEKVSTKKRVAQTFKEARSVLDELEQLQQFSIDGAPGRCFARYARSIDETGFEYRRSRSSRGYHRTRRALRRPSSWS